MDNFFKDFQCIVATPIILVQLASVLTEEIVVGDWSRFGKRVKLADPLTRDKE